MLLNQSRIHSWVLNILCCLVEYRLTLVTCISDAEVARPSPRTTPMDIAPSTGSTNAEGPCPMDEDAGESSLPFAVFDDVSDGSPAAMDGVVMGDQLVKFGSVDGGDDLLMRVAREGQANEGRGLPVIVLRRGERVHLTITPRRWSGRGLLGYGLFQKCKSTD